MSFDLEVSTSPDQSRRRTLYHPSLSMFRLEEPQPFDPAVFGFQNFAQAPRVGAPPPLNRASAPPPRAAHYTRTRIVPANQMQQAYGDDPSEREQLIGRQLVNRQGERRGGMDIASSLTLCAAVALWGVIVGVVFIMYWQFSATVEAATNAASPYFGEALNRTMSILQHVDDSTIGANEMVDQAQSISDQAVPAMQLALNQTAQMIARLERLAQSPVMQISLTQGAVGSGIG